MIKAEVFETVDVDYKGGRIECACGWTHDLGDGFNIFKITTCPNCDKTITTRIQNKVSYWDKSRRKMRHDVGDNRYFVLSNGIHVRYFVGHINTHYTRR